MALQTQREYARHRKESGFDGGSHAAVQKALATGRISYAQGNLIDPDLADSAWATNTEPRPTTKTSKPATNAKNTEGTQPLQAPQDADYGVSRAKREFYESELARLKVEEKRGKLISAETVRKVLYEAGRIIRAGHEDIVSQLAPDLASETAISAVERILKTRLDRLDTDLADRISKLSELFAEANEDAE